jgi:hypothetical protein
MKNERDTILETGQEGGREIENKCGESRAQGWKHKGKMFGIQHV